MQVKNPKFEISAVSKKQYPKGDLPEIRLIEQNSYMILYIEMEDSVWKENYLRLK